MILKYSNKLFFKLARRVIVVSAALVLLTILSFESLRFLGEKKAMEAKHEELIQTYSLLLSQPLSEGDERSIQLLSAGLIVDTDVQAFVIRDHRGRVVDAYGLEDPLPRAAGSGVLAILPLQLIRGVLGPLNFAGVASIRHATAEGTAVIGELELRLSPQRIYTLLISDLSMALILLGLIATVVLVTTRSAYIFFIGGRLNALLADIRRVAGSADHQSVFSGGVEDELACVIEAYNEAHSGRLASQQKVREYQDSLEQQVADRTLDLERELEEHGLTSRQLFFEKQRVDVTLNSIKDAVFNIDGSGRVVLANPACEQLLEIELLECLGRNILDLLPHEDSDSLSLVQDIQGFIASGEMPHKTHEIYLRPKSGELINAEVTLVPFVDDGQSASGMAVFIRDVTLQSQITEQLTYEARHDPLTGLVNRREFERRLASLNSGFDDSDERHVLCFLDLDFFKIVNDSAGHQAGDQVLKDIAEGLSHLLRTSDTLARFGGDEFGLLLTACDVDNALRICEAMRAFVASYRFASGGVDFIFGVSIGVVSFAPGAQSSKFVLKRADEACYAAKAEGRNRVCLSSAERA